MAGPPASASNLHLLGDIRTHKIHWVKREDIDKFKKIMPNKNKNSISDNIYDALAFGQTNSNRPARSSYIPIICPCHYVNHVKTDVDVKNSYFAKNVVESTEETRKTYKEMVSNSWTNIEKTTAPIATPREIQSMYGAIKKKEYNSDGKLFCLGCAIEAPLTDAYMMTAINLDTDSMFVLMTGISCIRSLKTCYEENKGDFNKIEDWLYNYDLKISRQENANNVSYSFAAQKTKYLGLRGTTPFMNIDFLVFSKMRRQMAIFCGDRYRYATLTKAMDDMACFRKSVFPCPIDIYSINNDKITIRCVSEPSPYKTIKLQEGQMNNVFGMMSKLPGRIDLIEL